MEIEPKKRKIIFHPDTDTDTIIEVTESTAEVSK